MNLLLKKRWFIAAVLLALITLICVFLSGGNGAAKAASVDENYYFNRISVEVAVNRDKTYEITETLKTQFRESGVNTGIIRDIQRVSRTTRVIDGKKIRGKSYIAKLDNVSVTLDGEPAKVTRSLYGQFHSVKMQKSDGGYLGAGEHTFVLKYLYDAGDDSVSGFDDFTLDVLGYAMAYTEEFYAEITFPDAVEASRVSFRTNQKTDWYPNAGNSEYVKTEGNKISMFAFPQEASKGYTVQVILPEDYFSQKLTFYWYYVIFAALALISVIACVWIFIVSTFNRKVFAPVEYLPPKDMTVMRISAVWRRGARYRDVGALILQWASKGLIKISRDGKRHLILMPDERLGDLMQFKELTAGMNGAETDMFRALFFNAGSPTAFSTRQFKKRLYSSKRYVYKCSEKLVEQGNKPKPVKVSGNVISVLLPFLSLVPTFAVLTYFSILSNLYVYLLLIIFMAAGTGVGCFFNKALHPLLLIFPIAFYGMPYFALTQAAVSVYDYACMLYVAPLWWAVCMFALPHFVKGILNESAKKEYAKLYGFKDFLLLTELERIKLVFDENPDYFKEILPYCYVMGISKKVEKRFAPLDFTVPEFFAEGLSVSSVCGAVSHSCFPSASSFSGGRGGGGSGGGGGGGSSGGGGGGGGSRGC